MNLDKEFRPKIHWGNPLWSYIHSLIKNTKDEQLLQTKDILKNLDKCIPCIKCIKNYTDSINDIDNIENLQNLFNWSVDLHNKVNKKYNKSEWNYDMASEEWKNSSSNYYLWKFIHTITIIDFENNKKYNDEIKDILLNLSICFSNFSEEKNLYDFYLEKLQNLNMNNSMILFYWSIDLHNEINLLYNKPVWPYNIALEKWTNISKYKQISSGPIELSGPSGPSGPTGPSELSGPSGPTGPSE
jgi:hypothetical protein